MNITGYINTRCTAGSPSASIFRGGSMALALLAASSLSVHAASAPMTFNFDNPDFSGTFSFDDTTEIMFGSFPGITAFDVDSLLVTYRPSFGSTSSWDLAEANLATSERIAIFFDTFGGAAIGATTGADPATNTLSALFTDSADPFGTNILLDFSSSLNDPNGPSNPWEIVQGATRVVVGGGTDRSFYTVSAVPLPAAVWLFGAGLISLFGFARRKA